MNKLKNLFSKIVGNIFLWSFIITILASLYLSRYFTKYEAKIVSKDISINNISLFNDINQDGKSEELKFILADTLKTYRFYANNGTFYFSENKKSASNETFFLDCNNDKMNEMFYFVQSKDSLFVKTVYFDKKFNYTIKEKFFSTVELNKLGGYDYEIGFLNDTIDYNSDGYNDLYVIIKSGYSYYPRRIFCFDVKNDTIYNSDSYGAYAVNANFIKHKNNYYIAAHNIALGNYKERFKNIPYPDTSTWIMVFDKNLHFLFPPIEKNGYGKYTHTSIVSRNDSIYFVSGTYNFDLFQKLNLEFYNTSGKLVSNIVIEDNDLSNLKFNWTQFSDIEHYAPFADNIGNLYLINKDFKSYEKINFFKSKYDRCAAYYIFDLDNDGKFEKILDYTTGIAIINNDLSDVCYLELNNLSFTYFSHKLTADGKTYFSIVNDNYVYVINYQKNIFYNLQYLIYLGIFIVIAILLYIFQKIRTYQLEQENIKLNKTITERTFEIEKQKDVLIKQAENLTKLDAFKQKMLSMIVHDLKNPLNIITMISENETVKNSASQMNILVENILDINKFEEEKFILNIKNNQLLEIVNKAFIQIEYLLNRKKINFINEISPNINVNCDAFIIERVIINILNNSAKFTDYNGEISIKTETNDKINLKIVISDNGKGIDEELQKRIFEKFEHQQNTDSTTFKSTGLGLHFCKLAINAHSQKIGIQSVKNQGTKVYFTLNYEANNINQKLNENYLTTIQISESEAKELYEFYEPLKQTPLYEITILQKIINEIDKRENINKEWKEHLKNAIDNYNKKLYYELIELIKPL